MPRSTVIVCSASARLYGDMAAAVMGLDEPPGATFSVPLSATGLEPATHFGCHTWASENMVALLEASKLGSYPPGFDPAGIGFTQAEADEFFGSMVIVAQSETVGKPAISPSTFFASVLTDNGLQRIETDTD